MLHLLALQQPSLHESAGDVSKSSTVQIPPMESWWLPSGPPYAAHGGKQAVAQPKAFITCNSMFRGLEQFEVTITRTRVSACGSSA